MICRKLVGAGLWVAAWMPLGCTGRAKFTAIIINFVGKFGNDLGILLPKDACVCLVNMELVDA